MADEEQPFLGFDPETGKKRKRQRLSRGAGDFVPKSRLGRVMAVGFGFFGLVAVVFLILGKSGATISRPPQTCDTPNSGYQCAPSISHLWGQYSPYYAVLSEISPKVPKGCKLTFAQLLSRHGSRDPTAGKSILYAKLIEKIKTNVQNYSGEYSFLANYSYELGADQLTAFGRQEMVNSGTDFIARYADLAGSEIPFIRASGQERVIDSASYFSRGFHEAKIALNGKPGEDEYPYPILIIPEDNHSNNTLSHHLCNAFNPLKISLPAQTTFASTFAPAITSRLNLGLPGASLTDHEIILLMDLCPFQTVASPLGHPSPFCTLFTPSDFLNYDYYQTLGKYYSYGPGAPLGPTQGVGFANELIARLTSTPVNDHTSTNTTLDADPATFPLGRKMYADFGHDNDMTAAFAALGFFEGTPVLETGRVMGAEEMGGFSASRTVPFAGRAVVEKMVCEGVEEEMVRVIVNGRVLPLEGCGGYGEGRCGLGAFVEGSGFARGGGRWGKCFEDEKGDGVRLESGEGGVMTA